MEGARAVSKGTMPINVVFDTEEEVKEARLWMKGKQKVGKLNPITRSQSDDNHSAAIKDTRKRK